MKDSPQRPQDADANKRTVHAMTALAKVDPDVSFAPTLAPVVLVRSQSSGETDVEEALQKTLAMLERHVTPDHALYLAALRRPLAGDVVNTVVHCSRGAAHGSEYDIYEVTVASGVTPAALRYFTTLGAKIQASDKHSVRLLVHRNTVARHAMK